MRNHGSKEYQSLLCMSFMKLHHRIDHMIIIQYSIPHVPKLRVLYRVEYAVCCSVNTVGYSVLSGNVIGP